MELWFGFQSAGLTPRGDTEPKSCERSEKGYECLLEVEAQRVFHVQKYSWDTNGCQHALSLQIRIPSSAIIQGDASSSQSGSEAHSAQGKASA